LPAQSKDYSFAHYLNRQSHYKPINYKSMKKIYTFCLLAFVAIGMQAQVTLVKDINPGTGNSSPGEIFVFGDHFYFKADDANDAVDHGSELWKSDGTTSGTVLVKDIRVGSSNSGPFDFFILNNELFFTANDGSASPWKTDGTESGTIKVTTGPTILAPVIIDGLVYYKHTNTIDGIANDLWQFDGVTQSAVTDAGTTEENIFAFVAFQNKIFLYANTVADDATTGNELYVYDPNTDLFSLVKDINPGSSDASISNFMVMGDKLYFEALSGLWETDGTDAGTKAVDAASALGGVTNVYAWNDKLFFEGDDGTNGDQLYVYDPVAGTTTNISNISGANSNHDPSDYCPYDGYLYYRGEDADDTDGNLFRTNGTSIEQLDNVVKDIDDIVVLNNKLYFEGEDASGTETTGNELFMLDPTTIPTAIGDEVKEMNISVYPNPSYGTINIKGLESAQATYSIYNLTGQCVAKGIVTNEQISFMQKGLYVLQINDGAQKTVSKITVK